MRVVRDAIGIRFIVEPGDEFPLPSSQSAGVDSIADARVVIDITHHLIHEGKHFFADDNDTDVDIAAPKLWQIIAPNTSIRVHLLISAMVSLPSLFEVFEEPNVTAEGTDLDAFNNDRNSPHTPTLVVRRNPTIAATGTRLTCTFAGGGVGMGRIGGMREREDELVLKQGTKYLVRFSPRSNDTEVSIQFAWYEV